MELLNTLGIDTGVLIAQVVNFAILLVALHLLVYKPILRLLDERKAKVRKSMEDAQQLERHVKEMEKERRERMKALDQEVQSFLEKAKSQAEQSRKDIVADAQREVDQLMAKGQQQLQDERTKMLNELQRMVTGISVELAEKILEREFSDTDQKRLMSSLEKDLPTLLR